MRCSTRPNQSCRTKTNPLQDVATLRTSLTRQPEAMSETMAGQQAQGRKQAPIFDIWKHIEVNMDDEHDNMTLHSL